MDPALLQSLPVVSFPAGQIVIEEGKPLTGLYFLEAGEVEIRRAGVLINQVEEYGAVFGDMSWLLATTPTATVTTLRESRFRHAVDPAAFCNAQPAVSLEIARILARRLDSMAKYLVNIKEQFRDRTDHFGLLDDILQSMMNKQPRHIPRRDAGH